MNSITLVGNLASDPTPQPLRAGNACRLPPRRRPPQPASGSSSTWDLRAARRDCAKHVTKGRLVTVHGRLDHESWRTSDGQPRSRHYVVPSSVELLDRPIG